MRSSRLEVLSPQMIETASNAARGSDGFAEHAAAVFGRIRQTMHAILQASPGSIRRAVDLERSLDLSTPLAWRVFKSATVDNALDVIEYMPTLGEMPRLLDAARKKSVPEEVLSDVHAAMEGYRDLLHEHAGNRDSLYAMVSALQPEKSPVIDDKCRKATFQHQSLMWGKVVDVNSSCYIWQPGPQPKTMQIAVICGNTGYHQLRASALHQVVMRGKARQDMSVSQAAFLRDFCSPNFDVDIREEGDWARADVKFTGLGRQAAINYFHLFTAFYENSDDDFDVRQGISIPSATSHLDLMIPVSIAPRTTRVRVYAQDPSAAEDCQPGSEMPVDISAVPMGVVTDAPAASGVPRYSELVQSVLKRQGWYGTKFELYRCRLAYPILHSFIRLEVKTANGDRD